jgi:hypothetical protein
MGDNLRDIRRTFALLLEPGSVAELRAPLAGRKGADAGYFDDFDKLAQAADSLSGKYPAVYVTLNPCDPALLARAYNRVKKWANDLTSDAQIVRRRNLLIDADAVRPGGVSSTDAEHELALARVRQIADDLIGRGWPAPLLADSANGGHLVYRIDLAADDNRVQRVLKALASRYDDDAIKIDTSVYNPARISKVYGTLACKGDNTPTRPHRWARILEAPDALEVVSAAQLDALLADLEPTPAKAKPASVTVTRGETFDLAAWMQRYAPDANGPEPWQDGGRVWTFQACPWRPDDAGATAYVAQLPNGAIKAACQHATCPGSRATGNHWRELRELREPGCYDRAGGDEPPDWLDDAPMPDETHPPATDETRPAPRLKVITADELLTRDWPEPRWTVPGLIPVGLVMLAGRPKVGKSWLALQLAQSVATGGRFFGEAVQQGAVLYLAMEDGSRRIANRMKLQRWPMGRGRCDFLHRRDAQELDGLGARAAQRLADAIREEGYRLIVVDTLSRLYRGEQNDVGAMTQALGPIQEMATRLDVTVLMLDHHKKSARGAEAVNDPIDDVLGSTAKSAVADAIMGLYRDEKRAMNLACTGRDIEDKLLALHFDKLTCCWQVSKDLDAPVQMSTPRRELLDALGSMEGAKCVELAEATGRDKGNTYKLLQAMLADGEVVQSGGIYRVTTTGTTGTTSTTGCSGCSDTVDNNGKVAAPGGMPPEQDADDVRREAALFTRGRYSF